MPKQTMRHARPREDQPVATRAPHMLAVVIVLTAVYALFLGWRNASQPADEMAGSSAASPVAPTEDSVSSFLNPFPTPTTEVVPEDALPIGIVAGHWGNDSGAVCDGWLREVDINLGIARRVVNTLQALGYSVDLLEEFDPRLDGYQALVLVSIHADACLYEEASGFKVARVEDSEVPELEDRLVSCLIDHYGARTALAYHEGSITVDMTHYHTFYEIDPQTPGAIIEVGFMLADRDILLNRQDLVAQGIIEGIQCFLQETP